MATKPKKKVEWGSGARSKIPKITDDMIIKNKEDIKKQKSKQGSMFWDKTK